MYKIEETRNQTQREFDKHDWMCPVCEKSSRFKPATVAHMREAHSWFNGEPRRIRIKRILDNADSCVTVEAESNTSSTKG